jgi:hypothetical protein
VKNKELNVSDFKVKTLRCEWQVVIQEIDPYGSGSSLNLARWLLAVHPTHESAKADLPNHGTKHKYLDDVWVPNNAANDYLRLEVQYREVPVNS